MKFYSILDGSTEDVLRRFLRRILKIEARIGTAEIDVESLEDALEAKASVAALAALEARVSALENSTSTEETNTEGGGS